VRDAHVLSHVAINNVIRVEKNLISAIAIDKAIHKGGEMFLAIVVDEKMNYYKEVPKEIASVLKQFEDVMLPQLPKKLPPRRAIDHRIELVLGTKPPFQAPYRMSLMELEELKKQLGELIDKGFIHPSKASYSAPILFQKKVYGSLLMCVDYQTLNKVTIKNKYPAPLIRDIVKCGLLRVTSIRLLVQRGMAYTTF
jgi:hypothetical protein